MASFLNKAKAIRTVSQRQPRLLFALDATASREPSWATARRLHRELFGAAVEGTSVAIQLCWYRGFRDFHASPWLTTAGALLDQMDGVTCEGGATQLQRLVTHYLTVGSPTTPVRAMVFVGDAVEESTDALLDLAARCRMKNQPLFMFQEGDDPRVAGIFEQMAGLSGGAYARFDDQSADTLRDLLGSVVRFASGGYKALTSSGRESDKILLSQLPRPPKP